MRLAILVLLLSVVSASRLKNCSRVLTYNAALSPDVENFDTRRQNVISALKTLDSDIMCLQEVWEEKDVLNLIDRLGDKYPYHYSYIHSDSRELKCPRGKNGTRTCSEPPACSANDVKHFQQAIFPCATINGCTKLLSDHAVKAIICLVKKCKTVLMDTAFTPDCMSCIMLTSPLKGVSLDACTGEGEKQFNGPGLLILSKETLFFPSYTSFFPGRRMMVPRGYLTVYHRKIGWVVCTHLSTTFFPYMEYDLDFTNYGQQQLAEVDAFLREYNMFYLTLAGGFNAGPTVVNSDPEKNLTGESTDVYEKLTKNVLTAPYIAEDGRCTICKSNSLAEGSNNAIDQILINGTILSSTCAERVLDEESLSDHYGVEVTVCREFRPEGFYFPP